ncbi:MAG TPA: hypothetical protein VGO00_27025 [Kofleriaceae bacterium]|jgi:hypothetical protein|nr:hypothetical protein [Kofleriaceae bacterium]
MKTIITSLLVLGTSSVALARPAHETRRPAPVIREHRVEARHERDHRNDRFDRGYAYRSPRIDYRWYGHGPVVVRPWINTTTFVASPSTFVDSVVVTYDDGRSETLSIGRYIEPANIAYELGIDRNCTRQIVAYARDSYGRSVSFAV